ncbi:MAG: hypothetical protein HeimC2_21490 [Candidatus Heimdallarchaeota archaeon LC_2]|nr:MAG: hypothetical protein HeimC2_21490 [Candidatus Heimdallarchaeota archaeon LC_2]
MNKKTNLLYLNFILIIILSMHVSGTPTDPLVNSSFENYYTYYDPQSGVFRYGFDDWLNPREDAVAKISPVKHGSISVWLPFSYSSGIYQNVQYLLSEVLSIRFYHYTYNDNSHVRVWINKDVSGYNVGAHTWFDFFGSNSNTWYLRSISYSTLIGMGWSASDKILTIGFEVGYSSVNAIFDGIKVIEYTGGGGGGCNPIC